MTTENNGRAIMARPCPTCQARPGEACTQPTNTTRRPVNWFHLAREMSDQE